MGSARHPNQTRLSCERCRRQKLRCTRPSPSSPSCTRCLRLGMPCEAGAQRRIGRPSSTAIDAASRPSVVAERHELSPPSFFFLQPEDATDTRQLGFPALPSPPPFISSSSSSSSSPYSPLLLDLDMAQLDQLPLRSPPPPPPLSLPPPPLLPLHGHDQACLLTVVDVDFRSLSSLNMRIHEVGKACHRQNYAHDIGSFLANVYEPGGALRTIQDLMALSQEYLSSVRQLQPKAAWLHHKVLWSQQHHLHDDHQGHQDQEPPGLDTPTALLVISCFVQIVKLHETVFALLQASMRNGAAGQVKKPAYVPLTFADVPVHDFPLQGVLFLELSIYVLRQTNLVLGLPSPWADPDPAAGRPAGLCSPLKYRNILNGELGAVEGPWTTRPAKLLEQASNLKSLLIDASMKFA